MSSVDVGSIRECLCSDFLASIPGIEASFRQAGFPDHDLNRLPCGAQECSGTLLGLDSARHSACRQMVIGTPRCSKGSECAIVNSVKNVFCCHICGNVRTLGPRQTFSQHTQNNKNSVHVFLDEALRVMTALGRNGLWTNTDSEIHVALPKTSNIREVPITVQFNVSVLRTAAANRALAQLRRMHDAPEFSSSIDKSQLLLVKKPDRLQPAIRKAFIEVVRKLMQINSPDLSRAAAPGAAAGSSAGEGGERAEDSSSASAPLNEVRRNAEPHSI